MHSFQRTYDAIQGRELKIATIIGVVQIILKIFALPYTTGLALLAGAYLWHGFGFFYYFDHSDIARAGLMPLFILGIIIILVGCPTFKILSMLFRNRFSAWAALNYLGRFQWRIWIGWIACVFVSVSFLAVYISSPTKCEVQSTNSLDITFGKSLIMLPSSKDWLIYYDQANEVIVTKERGVGREISHPSMRGEQWGNCLSGISWISHLLF